MFAAKHRSKIVAAAVLFLGLLIAVNILLVRWVRKTRIPANAANTPATAADIPGLPETVAGADTRPVRPPLTVIPALSFDDKQGGQENVDHLGYWDRNTWVRYAAVDFSSGVSSVVAVLSCGRQFAGRILFFRLDAHDGPVIAEVSIRATQGYEALAATVQPVTGVHDVYLTCNDGGFNLQSIKFIRPQSATNLISATSYSAFQGIKEPRPGVVGHTDGGDWLKYDRIDFGAGVSAVAVDLAMGVREAKMEFRLDAADGPVMATLVPVSTGDWNTFQVQECPVEGATGVHDLYVTFQGGRGLPDIRSIQFKRVLR
jgi:hypothetical protein